MKHEEKICPRCKTPFECKVGSISICQCAAVELSDAERSYLRKCFSDCLCASCISELKAKYHNDILEARIRRLMRNDDIGSERE